MTGWVELNNDEYRAEVLVEKNNSVLVFIKGFVEHVAWSQPNQIRLVSLYDLTDYGFPYPDYVAEITEQLEKHEQEKPHTFI